MICRDFNRLSFAPVCRPCYHPCLAGVLPSRLCLSTIEPLYEQFENATGSGPPPRLTGSAGRSGSADRRRRRDREPDPVEAGAGTGRAGPDPAVRRPAREGDRVVQLRERPARPDRHRPPLEREPSRRRPEEPQHRPGAHRRPAAGALRERRRRRRRRDPPRGRRTSTTCSAASTWCSASATRTRRCSET